MEIKNEALFGELDIFRGRFYEPQFLQLLIPREILTWLTVTSALAIENITNKNQNCVVMVQTSKEITR